MPGVLDLGHQEGAVEGCRAGRKDLGIVEEGRFHAHDAERPNGPIVGHEFESIEPVAGSGRGPAQGAAFEEPRGLTYGGEDGVGREHGGDSPVDADPARAVPTPQSHAIDAPLLLDVEVSEVLLTGKDAASHQAGDA